MPSTACRDFYPGGPNVIAGYYQLVSAYVSQDTAILTSLGLTVFLLAGWAVVRLFRVRWLEYAYVGQILILYVVLLFTMGVQI
jgi:hypothetical protein